MKNALKTIFANSPEREASSSGAPGRPAPYQEPASKVPLRISITALPWLTILLFWLTTCMPALAQENTIFTINASRISNGDWFENSGMITTDSNLVKIRDEHFDFRIRIDTTSYDTYVDEDGDKVDLWEGKVAVNQDTLKCVLAVYRRPESALFVMHLTGEKSISFHTERVDL